MKSPKHAGKAAKPKARVMYAVPSIRNRLFVLNDKPSSAFSHALVLPMPTLSAAKKRLKWEKLSEEQKVEAMAEEMHTDWRAAHGVPGCERWANIFEREKEPYRRSARSILNLISP